MSPATSSAVWLVGGDLNAVARVESAAAAAGRDFRRIEPGAFEDALGDPQPGLVLASLDDGGPGLVEKLQRARDEGRLTARIVCFFSHVDQQAGNTARAAGLEALPRGRFWRELYEIVAGDL